MLKKMFFLISLFAVIGIMVSAADKVKIGFFVKMPEEPWFQNEWKFADMAAKELGFEVIKIGTTDGEKVLGAIDNIAAQGAQGFVICTPDTRLGPSIMASAKAKNLKVFTVDDRFVGADGKEMADVPYMGISAAKIGEMVGQSLYDEFKKRGWKLADSGAIGVTFDELQTVKDRTDGSKRILIKNGFPEKQIYLAPEKTTDTEGSFNAANIVLTKYRKVKNWLIYSVNDEGVMGAVRATEGRGIKAPNVIGIGIGGSGTSTSEFAKKEMTGFFATALISPKRHGYETSQLLFDWISKGKMPALDTRTAAVMIDRTNYKKIMAENGLGE
jgi:L-arabinose transport system substrate-binding protein